MTSPLRVLSPSSKPVLLMLASTFEPRLMVVLPVTLMLALLDGQGNIGRKPERIGMQMNLTRQPRSAIDGDCVIAWFGATTANGAAVPGRIGGHRHRRSPNNVGLLTNHKATFE